MKGFDPAWLRLKGGGRAVPCGESNPTFAFSHAFLAAVLALADKD